MTVIGGPVAYPITRAENAGTAALPAFQIGAIAGVSLAQAHKKLLYPLTVVSVSIVARGNVASVVACVVARGNIDVVSDDQDDIAGWLRHTAHKQHLHYTQLCVLLQTCSSSHRCLSAKAATCLKRDRSSCRWCADLTELSLSSYNTHRRECRQKGRTRYNVS